MMLMWIDTGRPSSTAAAQNGSSSRERLSAPDGQFEISTPLAPRAFALRSASIDVSMPSDGICARPIKRCGVGRAELLEQEVVVRLDAREDEVVVVVTEEVRHRALRREQDLGVDAVAVHVLDALFAVVATGACFFVGDAEPPELVERHARRRHETDRVGITPDRREPRVTTLGVLDQLRRLFLELGRQPVVPDVGRLEDVAVGVDDPRLLRARLFRHAAVPLPNLS